MSAHTDKEWKFIEVFGSCEIMAGSRQLLRYIAADGENIANARLMSKAKLLLEALESCADWLDWLDDPRSGLGDNHKLVIKQAREAIAEARGESK